MSVEKPNFNGLIKEHIPFTVIPNFILQNLTNLEALGIWCHLISLPETWEINRAYLMNKFGIGRDKLNRILKHLIDNYLISYLWITNENGTIKKVSLVVKNGDEYHEKVIKNQQSESTTLKTRRVASSTTLKIHSLDNPLTGKPAPIKEITNIKENKKQREALSQNFKFDEANFLRCQDKRLDPEVIQRKFIAHMKSTGKTSADWQAEAEVWIERERADMFANVANVANPIKQETRNTTKFWEPGNPDYDRVHGLS